MYKDLFDEKMQNEMRATFLELSKLGKLKEFPKNKIIEVPGTDFIAIVVEGKIKQTLYSIKGLEKVLYILQPGEIFGEMDYFSCGKNNMITKTMAKSVVSIVEREILEKRLMENSNLYRYFLHSVTRKFRIVMLQMADMTFNDSIGRIANTLLRLSSQQGINVDNKLVINIPLTQQDLANLIGCSRITVTRGLNELRDRNIIDIENRKIIINDIDKLKECVDALF